MTALRPYAAAALLLAACSGPDTPEDPTWADVQPMLASNCVRCHGFPAANGAPDSFRLDVYDDTALPDGRIIRGASTMAEFAARRTNHEVAVENGVLLYDLMPPTLALHERQWRTLSTWYDPATSFEDPEFGVRPPRGVRAGNHEPSVRLLEPLERAGDDLAIAYEITDADHDMVRGQLTAEGPVALVLGDVHSGRDTIHWDVGAAPPGSYVLRVTLDDGGDELVQSRRLASVEVDHANTAATARIESPGPWALLHHDEGPVALRLLLADPDGDAIDIAVTASRGDQTVDLGGRQGASPGPLDNLTIDVRAIPPGTGWRFHVQVDDGVNAPRTVESTPFRVSDASTTLRFADVGDIFANRCTDCHHGPLADGRTRIPDLRTSFYTWEDDPVSGFAGVYAMRGPIYRRLIELGNMPPPSYGTRLTADELDVIAEWLLGGAPP